MKTRLLQCLLILMAFALNAKASGVSWEYNPYAFRYDMTVYIGLSSIDGASVADPADYQIGAFCNGECRGIAEHKTANGHNYIYLRIRSNSTNDETISFMIRNLLDGREGKAVETQVFASEQSVGFPSQPFELNVANEYNVTYVLGSTDDVCTFYYGEAVTAPEDPSRPCYDFMGWDQDIPTTMPAEDLTITALWTLNERSTTVVLNSAGYATYSCPENMVITTDGVAAYKAAIDGNDIVLTELNGYIPAGTGVLLYNEVAGLTVNLEAAIGGSPADIIGNVLKATSLEDGSLAALEADSWALGESNAFLHYTGNAYVHNRAYLVHMLAESARAMNIVFADDTDAISSVAADQMSFADGKYMHNGRIFIIISSHRFNTFGQMTK